LKSSAQRLLFGQPRALSYLLKGVPA
jgi:hypothetical protein